MYGVGEGGRREGGKGAEQNNQRHKKQRFEHGQAGRSEERAGRRWVVGDGQSVGRSRPLLALLLFFWPGATLSAHVIDTCPPPPPPPPPIHLPSLHPPSPPLPPIHPPSFLHHRLRKTSTKLHSDSSLGPSSPLKTTRGAACCCCRCCCCCCWEGWQGCVFFCVFVYRTGMHAVSIIRKGGESA